MWATRDSRMIDFNKKLTEISEQLLRELNDEFGFDDDIDVDIRHVSIPKEPRNKSIYIIYGQFQYETVNLYGFLGSDEYELVFRLIGTMFKNNSAYRSFPF